MTESNHMSRSLRGSGRPYLAAFAAVTMMILAFAAWIPATYAVTGSTNYILNPNSSSEISTDYSITTSLDGTSNQNYVLLGCTYVGNWTVQNNFYQPSSKSYIQDMVEVNGGGNSCYSVEYWPNGMTQVPYWYSFNIGYSSEFYSSSNTVTFTIYATSSTISSMYVTVASDSWVIYPSNFNTTLSMSYSSSSEQNFIMVGTAGGDTASFTAGAGSIAYSYVTAPGGTFSLSSESSNMAYGSLSSLSQSFTG